MKAVYLVWVLIVMCCLGGCAVILSVQEHQARCAEYAVELTGGTFVESYRLNVALVMLENGDIEAVNCPPALSTAIDN